MPVTLLKSKEPDLLKVLAAAGWYEGRKVNVDTWITAFRAKGKAPFDIAIAVLEEFGGLEINPPEYLPGVVHGTGPIAFIPCPSFSDSILYARWESYLGKKVYILGYEDAYHILIDEAECVYMDFNWGIKLGNDISSALEQLILRRSYPEIFAFDPDGEEQVERRRVEQQEWLKVTEAQREELDRRYLTNQ